MSDDYYAEVLENLPLAKTVELFSRHLPRWMAYWLAIWFRIRYYVGRPVMPRYAFRLHERLVRMQREDMPARALSRWAPRFEQLRDLGFQELACSNGDVVGAKESAAVIFLDAPGSTIAILEWLRMEGGEGVEEQMTLEFQSYTREGGQWVTGIIAEVHIMLADALVPNYIDAAFFGDRLSAERCYERHQQRLDVGSALQFSTTSAIQHYEQQRLRLFEHVRNAGLLRKLSPRELDRVRRCSLPA